jgi:hypothetical protein
LLIAAICVFGALVWFVRRWAFSTPATKGEGEWSLQHLRDMRAQGQITEREYEVLRSKMLNASRPSSGGGDEG